MLRRDSEESGGCCWSFHRKLAKHFPVRRWKRFSKQRFRRISMWRVQKENWFDVWQSKPLQENGQTVFGTVSWNIKIIAFGELPVGTLTSKLTTWLGVKFLGSIGRYDICDWVKLSQKCINSAFWSNQHTEKKVVFMYEVGNVQCDLRFEGQEQVKTSWQIFAGFLKLTNCQNCFLSECTSARKIHTAGLDVQHEPTKIICQRTRMITAFSRPPLESSGRGKFKSALTIFI